MVDVEDLRKYIEQVWLEEKNEGASEEKSLIK